ncbi:ABC transporter permease subunit [Bisgaard Taxon 10/6]|uniref:ABC transporter permease subunit n=1 Tax=Exercitatus varius TaxID=67857 RepID=A0AAW6Q818_9PAST|nr:ABC transporter permease subunit [Exercitatus varius]QOF68261.1 ABC transporter permease subunit [Actinobacillus sp. GY-402]MDG2914443.1 ABC transporter permease subunit [Exercitatus varius]MDG2918224.1 ABC transporter permease subunit [Exercitatus varius]MDG2940594.1 ABC transporter permease subunit [Exercitatus varius]MDG2941129.1 ABC transporter permease subunit [Exercitatus varius]
MLDKEPYEFRETETLRRIWLAFRRDRIALFSFYLFLLLILTALFSTFIAPYASDTQFIGKELTPPSWVASGEVAYFFGTDDLGRDVFSRIINGVSYTFGSALIVVVFTALIGGGLGILAGMSHGFKSRVLGHFLDTFLSVPILLISIVIATLMEPGLSNAMLAISLALLPHFIHEIYQAIQQELKKDYILMMRLDGAPNRVLLRETILPNIMVRYIREIVQAFVIALLEISSLSFISLGAQRPTPEWGAMIRDSLELIYIAPWAVILPGIAIIFVLLIVILMGNGICRTLERYGE